MVSMLTFTDDEMRQTLSHTPTWKVNQLTLPKIRRDSTYPYAVCLPHSLMILIT